MAVDKVLLVQTKIASFALADHVDALAVREATSRSWKAQAESDGPGLPIPMRPTPISSLISRSATTIKSPDDRCFLLVPASSESRKHG